MSVVGKISFVVVSALALSACGRSANTFVPFQVVHAVANAPSVDVSNRFVPIYRDVDFKEATGFRPVPAGPNAFAVDAHLPDGSLARVIGPVNATLAAGKRYSLVAAGSVGSSTVPLRAILVAGDNTSVASGKVRVQVVHGAAGAPPVDIHVTGPFDPIVPTMALAGGSTPFGAASDQLVVSAGEYRIRVTLPGQTDPVFDSGAISLPGGADLLVVAVDNTVAGRSDRVASPITLLVADGSGELEILDTATPADLRVVHAVPDFNGVDVYVNDPTAAGAPAIAGLDFPDAVPAPVQGASDAYLELPAGTLNVLVTAADHTGVIAIPATDVELEAGRQYTVYATGTLGTGIAPFITVDDDRSVATEARARIIHLAPGAGLVDIYVTAPMADIATRAPTFADVDFRDESGYVSLPAGDYDVTVTLANTKTAAIGPATISLEAGGVYTAIARNPDADIANDGFGLILLDDF